MVKFTSNNILATLLVFAYASLASAVPSELKGRDTDAAARITVCIDTNYSHCLTFPVVADTCRSFNGGLSGYNREISSAKIPLGFSCTFFHHFSCLSSGSEDEEVTLEGGNYPNFSQLPGDVNFNNKASSVTCSPL